MGRDDSVHLGGYPTAIGTLTRLAYAKAQAAGVSLDPVLKRAHLTHAQIANPKARLGVENQITFLNAIEREVRDEFLGFHLALSVDLQEAEWLYYVFASSNTVGEALQHGARYSSLMNEGISLRYFDQGDVVTKVDYVGVRRHPDRHQIEFAMVLLVRTFRRLTGLRLTPTAVRLTHLRKRVSPEVAKFFGRDVTFGASVDELAFAASVKDLPVLSADYNLNSLLIEHCEQAIAYRRPNRESFRSRVENAIVPLLPHGRPHAGQIALRLGMSQRTLARRLSSEGLTFSDLLDRLRADLAKRHIADQRISMSEITWLLGYQEASSFTHAFRRWTGMAPRQARSLAA